MTSQLFCSSLAFGNIQGWSRNHTPLNKHRLNKTGSEGDTGRKRFNLLYYHPPFFSPGFSHCPQQHHLNLRLAAILSFVEQNKKKKKNSNTTIRMVMVGREETTKTQQKKINNILGTCMVASTNTPRRAEGGHSFATTDDDDFETFLDEKNTKIKFGHRWSAGALVVSGRFPRNGSTPPA